MELIHKSTGKSIISSNNMKTVINTVQMFLLEVLEGWKIHFTEFYLTIFDSNWLKNQHRISSIFYLLLIVE